MKRTIFSMVCCWAVLLSGCKSSGYQEAEQIMEDYLRCYDDAQKVYATVKDVASAKAAAAKINEICDRIERLKDREESIRIRDSEESELEEKYMPRLQEKIKDISEMANQIRAGVQGDLSFREADKRLEKIGASVSREHTVTAKDNDDLLIVGEMTNILEESADVLDGVKTRRDAERAKSKLAALDKKAEDIRELMKKRIKNKQAEDAFLETVRMGRYLNRNKRSLERTEKALKGMEAEVQRALDLDSFKGLGGLVVLLVRYPMNLDGTQP